MKHFLVRVFFMVLGAAASIAAIREFQEPSYVAFLACGKPVAFIETAPSGAQRILTTEEILALLKGPAPKHAKVIQFAGEECSGRPRVY